MNELKYFERQLDLIVGLLEISDLEVYNMIKGHDKFNLGCSIDDLYENEFINFQNHITTSAFILGFTHFEDFITKMIIKLFEKDSSKNSILVSIDKFKDLGDSYVELLAKEQSKKIGFSQKIKIIEKTFKNFEKNELNDIHLLNEVRNCLMHNNGFADRRLRSKYVQGEKIVFSVEEVNDLGFRVRAFAEKLWENINQMKS